MSDEITSNQFVRVVPVGLLIIALGCGGGSCAGKNRKEDDGAASEKAQAAEGTDESSTGEGEEKEKTESLGRLERPPIFRLSWEEPVDIDLSVEIPPDESGDRIQLGVGTTPGPGGGDYETGDGGGCGVGNCDEGESPFEEWVFWPSDAEPLSGTYEVQIKHEDYQTWDVQDSLEPMPVNYRVEAFEATSVEEARDKEPIATWSGTIEPTDDETWTDIDSFTIE